MFPGLACGSPPGYVKVTLFQRASLFAWRLPFDRLTTFDVMTSRRLKKKHAVVVVVFTFRAFRGFRGKKAVDVVVAAFGGHKT